MYTIIIAEDEPKLLRHIKSKLEEAAKDFKIIACAENGREALELIRELNPDVLFTDIVMPGMDGLDLIKKLRSESYELPIVILSGYDDFTYAQQAIKYSVRDYLLKPLNEDELQKTLIGLRQEIREGILKKALDIFRHQIESGSQWKGPIINEIAEGKYLLIEICLGNLYKKRNSINDELAGKYRESWLKLNRQQFFSGDNTEYFWLINEAFLNRKFIILKSKSANPQEIDETINQIKEEWISTLALLPVNIIYTPFPVPFQNIPKISQNMKIQLKKIVSPGISRIVPCLVKNDIPSILMPTDPDFEKKLFILAQSGNFKNFRKEIHNRLNELANAEASQEIFSIFFSDLIRLLKKSTPFISQEELDLFHIGTEKILSSEWSYIEIINRIEDLLIKLIPQKDNLTPSRIADLLETYLTVHYMESISLESVSDHLGFNVSYLSQIFKKYKKETPGHFLINQRIEKAKELLIERQELKTGEIGEMVGYEDTHYFYRIFKKYTGLTPATFRKKA